MHFYGSQHYSMHGCSEIFYFIALENIAINCTTIHLNVYLKRALACDMADSNSCQGRIGQQPF